MIAEIRSDGAEPGRNSRRHDAAPDSRPGSFFILAFPSRRQAEPAPISRRHDAAPDSRIGFVRAPTACLAVLGLCKNFVSLVQAGRLSLHPFRGGMMPRPIRGRLSLHPFRERTSCGSKLNALAQVACLRLRQAEPAPNSRIGFVRGPTACPAVLGLCLLRGGRWRPSDPGGFCGASSPCW